MKLNDIEAISTAVEDIAMRTDTKMSEIIDVLTGVCWDEEDAGELKESLG